MYACICMYVYVCMYVCVYMYVCMYVCMCVYAYMCMYVCITYWGNCPGGNVLPKTGGGIVRGEIVRGNCPGGNCPGGIVLHPSLVHAEKVFIVARLLILEPPETTVEMTQKGLVARPL